MSSPQIGQIVRKDSVQPVARQTFAKGFIIVIENLEEPNKTPRPLALTGITVHTKSITSNDKDRIVYKWLGDNH